VELLPEKSRLSVRREMITACMETEVELMMNPSENDVVVDRISTSEIVPRDA